MKTVVSSKGQIVLPAELRQQDAIEPGEEFEILRIKRGEYRLKRRSPTPNEGLVDLLLACPVKGFFVPIPLSRGFQTTSIVVMAGQAKRDPATQRSRVGAARRSTSRRHSLGG